MKDAPALHLTLEFTRTTRVDEAFVLPTGNVEYVLRTEGGGAETVGVDWNEPLFADLDAVRRPGADPAVIQRVGRTLRKALAPAGWSQHEEALVSACARGARVILTIRSNAAELYALPWELLTLKSSGQHLGELPGVLLRYAWPESETHAELPSPAPEGGRILFAWSAAAGAVPAGDQIEAVQAAASRGHHGFDPCRDVVQHLSLGRLDAALAAAAQSGEDVRVLHLLCHGGPIGQTYGLAWDSDDGSGEKVLVDAARLRQILAPHAGTLRLVVLSACDSGNAGQVGNHLGSVAQNLHQAGIQAVIASRFPLSIAGSVRFVQVFYDRLLNEPASVEDALSAARQQLLREAGQLDWASLTLHARPEDGDDTRPVVLRPYRGLLAFESANRSFFFGRDAEVDEALADLAALRASNRPRFLVVTGASGTGKSSIVFAGVLPRLLGESKSRSETDDPESIRREVSRLAHLLHGKLATGTAQQALATLHREVEALTTASGQAWEAAVLRPGATPLATLDAAVASRRHPERPFLLVVDQFEEIFTHVGDPAERQAFATRLWNASKADDGVHVIASLRVDFLGECGQIALDKAAELRLDRVAYDEAHRVFVAQMGAAELRTVIEEPARKVGLVLPEGLASRMIGEIGGDPAALPLVEYLLDRLWRERDGHALRLERYEELGGVFGALERMADTLFDSLDEAEQRLARRLFARLTHVNESGAGYTRQRVPLARVLPSDPAQRAALENVIRRFVDARLVLRQDEGGQIVLEVAHEALIKRWKRLAEWLMSDRAQRVELERVERWAADFKAHGVVLRGAQLAFAKHVCSQSKDDVDQDVRALLDASERAEAREIELRLRRQRTVRRWLGAGMLAGAVLSVVMLFLLREARLAEAEARDAETESMRKVRLATAWTFYARHAPTDAVALLGTADQVERGDPQWRELGLRLTGTPMPHITLADHQNVVQRVAWDGEDELIVTASADSTARVFNADGSGRSIALEHPSWVSSAVFDRSGTHVLTSSNDGSVRIWSFDREAFRRASTAEQNSAVVSTAGIAAVEIRLTAPDSLPIRDAVYNPDQQSIATGSNSGDVSVWTLPHAGESPGPRQLLGRHAGAVVTVAYSHDGRRLVSASEDGSARIWSLSGGAPLTLSGHANRLTSAEFSSDDRWVVSSSEDGTARVWDATTGTQKWVLKGHQAGVNQAVFDPSGISTRIVTVSGDDTVRIWSLKEDSSGFRKLATMNGHMADITSVAFSRKADQIATGAWDRTVRVWSLAHVPVPLFPDTSDEHLVSAASDRKGHQFVGITSKGQMMVVQRAQGRARTVARPCAPPGTMYTDAVFDPSGNRIAAGRADGQVELWRGESGGELWRSEQSDELWCDKRTAGQESPARAESEEAINAVVWLEDGQRFLALNQRGQVLSGDLRGTRVPGAGMRPVPIAGLRPSVRVVAASPRPSARPIAVGHQDGVIEVLAPDRPGDRITLSGGRDAGAVTAIAFSDDATRLVSAFGSGRLSVWRLSGSGEAVESTENAAPIDSVRLDRLGEKILTRSLDNAVRIWRPASAPHRSQSWAIRHPPSLDDPWLVLGVFDAAPPFADFASDGAHFLTIDSRGLLQQWEASVKGIRDELKERDKSCMSVLERERHLGEDPKTAAKRRCDCARSLKRTPVECSDATPAGRVLSERTPAAAR